MRIIAVVIVLLFCSGCQNHLSISELQKTPITVEIKGEVKHPGVYTFEYGTTVDTLLNEAGIKETADVSGINGLTVLKDHDSIVVQKVSEEETLISINTANLQQLDKLPGIGPVIAQRIIDYRQIHGHFQKIEDITKVKGIGRKTFEKLKDRICL